VARPNYAAAKSALHGATKSLACEMASRGITVVAPGVIEGAMVGEQFPPEVLKQLVPAARAGKPEEVAALRRWPCG
jgi:3-oxoacyl-[acyl-carrier protein] reductase